MRLQLKIDEGPIIVSLDHVCSQEQFYIDMLLLMEAPMWDFSFREPERVPRDGQL